MCTFMIHCVSLNSGEVFFSPSNFTIIWAFCFRSFILVPCMFTNRQLPSLYNYSFSRKVHLKFHLRLQKFLSVSVSKHLFPSSHLLAVGWYLLCLSRQHVEPHWLHSIIVITGWYCKSDIQYVSETMTIFALWFVLFSCKTFWRVI